MENSNILLLEKVFHLAKRLEKVKIYELLEPWQFNGYDLIEIQNAAKKISNFIDLPNLTFIVTYKAQEHKVAGHIELNNNSEEGVFIEIDEKYKDETQIILAILAHEICHKFIHVNGLTQFGYENEILTDVATVYSGLGKLSLNGCEIVRTSTETTVVGNERRTTTTTNTQKVGYLNRSQFAFLYKVICIMRRIPDEYAYKNLYNDAVSMLRSVVFNPGEDLFHNDFTISTVLKTIKKQQDNLQRISALNLKLSKTIGSSLSYANKINSEIHVKLKSIIEKNTESANIQHNPESLNFLKNLILLIEIDNLEEQFHKDEHKISDINDLFLSVTNLLISRKTALSSESRDFLYNIECPICKHKMLLRQDKLVKINCRNCKYSFMVDNTQIEERKENTIKKNKSIKQKFKEIISIIKE